jgi:hypothetical protein
VWTTTRNVRGTKALAKASFNAIIKEKGENYADVLINGLHNYIASLKMQSVRENKIKYMPAANR